MLATGLADPDLVHEDLVVMLAEDGMMSRKLSDAADRLEMLGRRPEWMLVVRSPAAARKRFGAKATNGDARPAHAPRRPLRAPDPPPPAACTAAPVGLLRS